LPKRTGETSKNNVAVKDRDQNAIRLRMMGYTYDSIAGMLGYKNESGPYKAVQREMKRRALESGEDVSLVRQMEIERLDRFLLSVFPKTLEGDAQAISTAMSIMNRRAALLGLDAPKQFDQRVRVEIVSYNQALRDFLDIYKDVHGESDLADKLIQRIDQIAQERFQGVVT
jgi:hypothetical protein